jgi:predicted TIM-barrel fold metal-dependent hydrolase
VLELEHRFRVVDVHARLDPGEAGADPPVGPDRLQRELRQAGVVRSVVFPGPRSGGYLAANNAVARLSVDRPFVAFARLDGVRDPTGGPTARIRSLARAREDHHASPEDVEQYAYDDRFHGFRLDPVADGLPDRAVLDRLEGVGLPVVVHGGRGFPPGTAAETLLDREFPVVLAGFGGYPLDRELMHEAVDRLGEFDDYYLDTSFVRYREPIERALREHPDRVLFGSGAPATHPNVAVMEVLTLDVPEDTMRRVFAGNASRVVEALAPRGEP